MIRIYRLMYLSRRVDDREILLKRQQKIFFQISAAGHEALQVSAALAMRPGYDWFFPYYRDRGLCLALGVTPTEMLLQAVGAATDPASGGRQMPTHWSSPPLHIVSTSSSTTTQLLHAVGCAEAGRYFSRHPEAAQKAEGDYRAFREVEFHGDEVVFTSLGEGSTSQGEFWEALNTASNRKLPVIFCVEDNGYAISVPVEVNTPGKHFEAGGELSQLSFCRGRWDRCRGVPARLQRSGGLLPQRPGTRVCAWARGSALLALAFRRRQAVPLDRRARGRRHARPSGEDADAPAARGHFA